MNKKCIGCQIQDGSFKVNGGFIHETENFNVIQDYLIPIPGFMVLQSKRHITSIEEFNEDEQIEFTYFLFKIRKAMKKVLSIKTVYFVQEEDSCHFHLWLLPIYDWMEKGISNARKNMNYAKIHMNDVNGMIKVNDYIQKLKDYFNEAK